MKTVLLTGFEPFGGARINPALEVVRRIGAESEPGVRLRTLVLPVDMVRAPAIVLDALEQQRPDGCLMLGMADGVAALQIERVGLNLLDFRIPDNGGHQPIDEPVVAGGPAAYFASAPVRAMHEAALGAGVPAELSLSAGTFLCNQVLYTALHHCATGGLATRCGFVHVPPLPEQMLGERRARPSMSLDMVCRGVHAMLGALVAQH
jgi:pyroglutamyl-peptidase